MCLITTNKFSDVILKFLQLFLPVDNSNKQYQLKKKGSLSMQKQLICEPKAIFYINSNTCF